MSGESLTFRLVAILFPIFGIVAAGYFYARHHKPEMAVANRLNMDVFVPALVFAAMAGKSFDLAAYAPLALGGFLVLAVCGLLAWPVAKMAFGVAHPAPRAEGEPDFFLVVDVSAMSQREFALKNALLGEEIQGLRRAGFVVEDPVDAEDLVALNPAFVRFARRPTRLDFLLDHPGQGLTWVGTFGPVDRLEEGGARGVEILERHGFPAIIVSRPMASGHYAVLRFIEVFNRFDPDDVARVTRCQDEVGLALLDLGFVPYKCSPLLWRHVSQRMDPGARALITRVQDLLDPAGIMNPGKLGRG